METMTPTDKPKQPEKAKPRDPNRRAVSHLWFEGAITFPGVQETHVQCGAEPLASGRSWTCVYIADIDKMELRHYTGGTVPAFERLIPMHRVQQWEWL